MKKGESEMFQTPPFGLFNLFVSNIHSRIFLL